MKVHPETILYLEHLQKNFNSNQSSLHYHHIDQIKEIAPQVIESIKNKGFSFDGDAENFIKTLKNLNLPTQYEDPLAYFIISKLTKEIELTINELQFHLPIHPLFGTIPSGRINAMTILVRRSKEFIILFERQLFRFADEMSKIMAHVIPFEGEIYKHLKFAVSKKELDRVEKYLSQHPEIEHQFKEVVTAYLIKGDPNTIEPTLARWPSWTMAGILTNSAELFILGHEYGHILCGHFDHSKVVQSFIGQEQVVQVVPQWDQEHEADMKGLELMIRAQQRKRINSVISFWGADFFFGCIDILERGISLIETGDEGNRRLNDHPPSGLRREVIRQGLKDSLPEDIWEPAINLGMFLESIMEMLFKGVRPYFIQLNKKNCQLAERWRK